MGREARTLVSIPAGFLLFFVALTGVLLQLGLIRVGHRPPGHDLPGVPAPADFHLILKDLHAGYLFGWPDRVISILVGLALVVLAWTGLTMW
jgi:uncharacterized iron-regulated membrane protein